MKFIIYFVPCCLLFSMLHETLSLKCRTGNRQSDDQFQKIMQVCRRRYLGYDRENGGGGGGRDYNGRDTDSQESSDSRSEEDLFDGKFLSSGGSSGRGYNGKNSEKVSGRQDYAGSSSSPRNATSRQFSGRNWNGRSGSSNNAGRSSYGDGQSNSGRRGMNGGGHNDNDYSNRYNGNRNNYNGNGNGNGNGNNDDNNDGEREQACVVQCFFNELNLVDQRGFPERSAVVGIMTQNVQDSELRDFVEESVIECYHYLNNSGRQEKCQFSQNLLSCLAEKGSERCEDWDDE